MKATGRNRRGADPFDDCAGELLETTLLVMRMIRAEVRRRRPANLSVTQLRTLAFFHRNPGASLADVAEHLGLGAPTASRQAFALVRRGYLSQRTSHADRRRRSFRVTTSGAVNLRRVYRATRHHLAGRLKALPLTDCRRIATAMMRLRPIVTPVMRHGAELGKSGRPARGRR